MFQECQFILQNIFLSAIEEDINLLLAAVLTDFAGALIGKKILKKNHHFICANYCCGNDYDNGNCDLAEGSLKTKKQRFSWFSFIYFSLPKTPIVSM
jgi:hypothetical protein